MALDITTAVAIATLRKADIAIATQKKIAVAIATLIKATVAFSYTEGINWLHKYFLLK